MGMIVSWMLVAAAIGAFAVTALSGCFVIPALHKLHFGQTIRESGPTWHNKKQGTPTMGGLCFIFGILVACGLVYAGFYRYAQDLLGIVQVRAALLALFLAFGSGFIGFLDDYIRSSSTATWACLPGKSLSCSSLLPAASWWGCTCRAC